MQFDQWATAASLPFNHWCSNAERALLLVEALMTSLCHTERALLMVEVLMTPLCYTERALLLVASIDDVIVLYWTRTVIGWRIDDVIVLYWTQLLLVEVLMASLCYTERTLLLVASIDDVTVEEWRNMPMQWVGITSIAITSDIFALRQWYLTFCSEMIKELDIKTLVTK